jgi:inhibitor of cysteine peptidase
MIELDDAAAGQPVTVQVGQRLQITLSENRTTGYAWQLAGDCDRLLTMERNETKAPSGAPGASGTRTWVFQALAEGNCEVRFESRRSWQKDATGKTVVFPVTVQKSA